MADSSPIDSAEVGPATGYSIAVLTITSAQNQHGSVNKVPIFLGKDIHIGRDKSICSPSFQNDLVSKAHLRIYSIVYDGDLMAEYPPMVYCEDRQSRNGTYVNDILIGNFSSPRSPYLLNDGDVIGIRPHWTFHFHQKSQGFLKTLNNVQKGEIELFNDQYIISDRLLGSGIYGTVYLANDIVSGKQLACKIVDIRRKALTSRKSETSLNDQTLNIQAYAEEIWNVTEAQKKLIREVEILSKLSHPNIVTLHKAFRSPHSLYIFNELAAGGDLFSFLQANGHCLEDLHARIISRQVAIAVEYLHSEGIAHRDLKPENILVMRTGIGHRVVLTDFGCAGYIKLDSTRMMSTVGTYDYVAPEVHGHENKGYTEAIDMWSMGIITLCLLTGEALISFSQLQKLSQAHIGVILTRASRIHPQWRTVNSHGRDYVNRLLVLNPAERMTANEAVNHDWFRKPARIAMELDKLYERANVFWSRRPNSTGLVEDLPDLASRGRKLPDVTVSPYFGLSRHLRAEPFSRSTLRSKRKRVLDELQQSASHFIPANPAPYHKPAGTNNTKTEPFIHPRRPSAAGASQETPPVTRPPEPSPYDPATIATPATPLKMYTTRSHKPKAASTSATQQRQPQPPEPASPSGTRDEPDAGNSKPPKHPRNMGPRIKDVDANNLFDTVPLETRAARVALDEPLHSSSATDLIIPHAISTTPERSPGRPARHEGTSHTSTCAEWALHDEAARELPSLTTAKVFSEVIARKRRAAGERERGRGRGGENAVEQKSSNE